MKSSPARVFQENRRGFSVLCLLYYLDCACGALRFACSADKAFLDLDRRGLAILYLVDPDWAGVYAGFASGAFIVVNNYFYHVITSVVFYWKTMQSNKSI